MNMISAIRNPLLVLVAVTIGMLFSAPYFSRAQGQDEQLSSTIRAAISSDPRTADMSEGELEAMVAALSEEAVVQGVTSNDIVWRPVSSEEVFEEGNVARCGRIPAFLCALNEAFGFTGSDVAIPITLGISSALLLFIIGMFLLRLGHHPVAGAMPPTAT